MGARPYARPYIFHGKNDLGENLLLWRPREKVHDQVFPMNHSPIRESFEHETYDLRTVNFLEKRAKEKLQHCVNKLTGTL